MILVSGATGTVGREVTSRLLMRSRELELSGGIPDKIALLTRPNAGISADSRIKAIVEETFGVSLAAHILPYIEVIEGDITEENFGLGSAEFAALSGRVSSIYHMAANTNLSAKLSEARRNNVRGTMEMLRLAELAGAKMGEIPFNHVSTAYVVGDVEREVTSDELSLDRIFRNAYEQSKAESELEVRNSSRRVRSCVFRPSVIVGDSITGQTTAFNVMYIPARMVFKGLLTALPAQPNAPFDVVPVDYVADAIVHLSERRPEKGVNYHLCAGVGRESSPLEILETLLHTVNTYCTKRFHTPAFISPDTILRALQSLSAARNGIVRAEKIFGCGFIMIRQLLPFLPYMSSNPRFNTDSTILELSGTLPPPPLFRNYAEIIFRYCIDTNWGRTAWTNPGNFTLWSQRVAA